MVDSFGLDRFLASEVVAVLLNNSPENIEAHFGIPMTGAVLNPLNYRLDARTLTFMLGHAEAKILIVDREYSKLVSSVLATFPPEKRPFVIDVDDPLCYLVSENLKTIVFSRRDQGTQPGSAEFLLRIS